MSSTLLNDALHYEKQKKWQKAIECFEYYFENNHDNIYDRVYASYIKCLRMNGEIKKAIILINQRIEANSESESLLEQLYSLQDNLNQWEENRRIAEKLIELNPTNPKYYFFLGRSLAYLRENTRAKQVYKIGLEYKHKLSFQEINQMILKGITDSEQISTEFKFLGGRNNYGVLLHDIPNYKYFTKISKATYPSKREKLFYEKIYTNFPRLHTLAPKYITSQTIENIQYLTIQRIETMQGKKSLDEVVKLSQIITSIKYNEIIKHCSTPKFPFIVRSRGSTVVNFFSKIHEEIYNKKMISEFKSFGLQNNYPSNAMDIINTIESLIIKNQLYAFIVPELHYSLLHGDIIPSNMMFNKVDGKLQIFDWTNFTIGPRFIDIARFVTISSISYEEVKNNYLFNNDANGHLSILEKTFFLYAYILLYYITLKNKGMNTHEIIAERMYPALKDMSYLVDQFKKENYKEIKNIMMHKNQLLQEENDALKNKISKLKKRNAHLNKQYQNIMKSKSFKITYALRKLVKYIKRK